MTAPRSPVGGPAVALPDDTVVVVCDACLCASCWHYRFPCERAKTAGLTKRTVGELRMLDREHPSNWDVDPNTGVAKEPA